jgi:hypothetical protein
MATNILHLQHDTPVGLAANAVYATVSGDSATSCGIGAGMASLQRVVLLVRDVGSATKFWHGVLGLSLQAQGAGWASLRASQSVTLSLLQSEANEAAVCTGYSPILQFNVEDMDTRVPQLLMGGAHMDGAIRYNDAMKVCVLRAPTGHMFSIVEGDSATRDETPPAAAIPTRPSPSGHQLL